MPRRPAHLPLALALLAGLAGASPTAAFAQGPAVPPAVPGQALAGVAGCHVAGDRVQRFAAFSGQMQPVPRTHSMQIRIDVQERLPGGRYAMASTGEWRTSQPGVRIFRYVRQVLALDAPADFRAVAHFRWIAGSGRVLRRADRRTAPCVEPDPRPDLGVQGVQARVDPAGGGGALYSFTVANTGLGAATGVDVVLSVDGSAQARMSIAELAPGSHAALEQHGPRCAPGSQVSVALDPGHRIDEAPGGGATVSVGCPLA